MYSCDVGTVRNHWPSSFHAMMQPQRIVTAKNTMLCKHTVHEGEKSLQLNHVGHSITKLDLWLHEED